MGKNRINKSITHIFQVLHLTSELVGSVLCVALIPFYPEISFWHLDIVESFTISSFAVMLASGEAETGWVNQNNCIVFLLIVFLLMVFLFLLLIGLLKKKNWVNSLIVVIYAVDIFYLIFHYFFLTGMVDLHTKTMYVILSIVYKLLGIAFFTQNGIHQSTIL